MFNQNPNTYLKNADGTYKYDVIMFGSLDSNGKRDLSTTSLNATKEFIDSGKGVLFGHDTVSQWQNRANFPKLENYINVKTYGYKGTVTNDNITSMWTMPWSGGTEISVTKKGTLTNYPWEVGDIGAKLTVPYTHTNSQVAKGDVWMKFSNPHPDDASSVIIDINEYSDNGVGTNMAYLTTYNNTAMIQTGHAIGRYEVTADEQKLMANTLFYLNQLSTETALEDYSGQDVSAPDMPKFNEPKFTEDGYVELKFDEVKDNGSTYEYYVESKTKDDNSLTLSNVVSETITSGLKGYSYVIDDKATTIPDDVIEQSTNKMIKVSVNKDSEVYVHIKAIDNVGNASETYHYRIADNTNPVISYTLTPNTWTTGTVTINVTATDVDSGVKQITLPNGMVIKGTTASLTVNKNGIYYFIVADYMGNRLVQGINVNNIDTKAPEVNINNNENWTNQDVQINITGTD